MSEVILLLNVRIIYKPLSHKPVLTHTKESTTKILRNLYLYIQQLGYLRILQPLFETQIKQTTMLFG